MRIIAPILYKRLLWITIASISLIQSYPCLSSEVETIHTALSKTTPLPTSILKIITDYYVEHTLIIETPLHEIFKYLISAANIILTPEGPRIIESQHIPNKLLAIHGPDRNDVRQTNFPENGPYCSTIPKSAYGYVSSTTSNYNKSKKTTQFWIISNKEILQAFTNNNYNNWSKQIQTLPASCFIEAEDNLDTQAMQTGLRTGVIMGNSGNYYTPPFFRIIAISLDGAWAIVQNWNQIDNNDSKLFAYYCGSDSQLRNSSYPIPEEARPQSITISIHGYIAWLDHTSRNIILKKNGKAHVHEYNIFYDKIKIPAFRHYTPHFDPQGECGGMVPIRQDGATIIQKHDPLDNSLFYAFLPVSKFKTPVIAKGQLPYPIAQLKNGGSEIYLPNFEQLVPLSTKGLCATKHLQKTRSALATLKIWWRLKLATSLIAGGITTWTLITHSRCTIPSICAAAGAAAIAPWTTSLLSYPKQWITRSY